MAKITWNEAGTRHYETGVDHGVLYLTGSDSSTPYNEAHAWNGLTAVTEAPSGAEPTPLYADNIKYLNLVSVEEFGATVEAYTYPDAFALCDGSYAVPNSDQSVASPFSGITIGQQARKTFGLSYRTRLGNDEEYENHGYKLHLIYGALAAPSEKAYATINDSPEAVTFSWSLTTTPVSFPDDSEFRELRPTALVTIDSTKVSKAFLDSLEEMLYGTESESGRLPLPSDIIALHKSSVGTEPDPETP